MKPLVTPSTELATRLRSSPWHARACGSSLAARDPEPVRRRPTRSARRDRADELSLGPLDADRPGVGLDFDPLGDRRPAFFLCATRVHSFLTRRCRGLRRRGATARAFLSVTIPWEVETIDTPRPPRTSGIASACGVDPAARAARPARGPTTIGSPSGSYLRPTRRTGRPASCDLAEGGDEALLLEDLQDRFLHARGRHVHAVVAGPHAVAQARQQIAQRIAGFHRVHHEAFRTPGM